MHLAKAGTTDLLSTGGGRACRLATWQVGTPLCRQPDHRSCRRRAGSHAPPQSSATSPKAHHRHRALASGTPASAARLEPRCKRDEGLRPAKRQSKARSCAACCGKNSSRNATHFFCVCRRRSRTLALAKSMGSQHATSRAPGTRASTAAKSSASFPQPTTPHRSGCRTAIAQLLNSAPASLQVQS